MGGYWVYIVKCSDGSLYTGSTSDVVKRVAKHNSGKGSKYTRSRLPVTLAYAEEQETLRGALRREFEIKKLSRSAKLLLCSSERGRPRHGRR